MRRRHGNLVRAALALAGLGLMAAELGGCHSSGEDPAAVAGKPATKKAAPRSTEPAVDPAVAEANRTMVSGIAIGTSTAPLDIRFDLRAAPSPGEPFEIDVAVLPEAPAPVMRLEVTGGEGLSILDPDGSVAFEKIQAGSVTHLKVRASSATAGTRLVAVRATLELPGGPEARIFAFPVVVGAQAPVPAPKAATR
jgi:hypothetical protein